MHFTERKREGERESKVDNLIIYKFIYTISIILSPSVRVCILLLLLLFIKKNSEQFFLIQRTKRTRRGRRRIHKHKKLSPYIERYIKKFIIIIIFPCYINNSAQK